MVTGVFAMQASAMFVLLFGPSLLVILVFLVVFGTSYGAQTLARATAIAELFGSAHYGRISSVMSIFLILAGTIAPVGAGLIYDHFGSYQPLIILIICLALAATGVMLFARPDAERNMAKGAAAPIR
jgi:MFS family permease